MVVVEESENEVVEEVVASGSEAEPESPVRAARPTRSRATIRKSA